MKTYTKADLEQIVMTQLENLNAMNDLLSIMKMQNELLHNASKKLKVEISEFKEKYYSCPTGKRSPVTSSLQVGKLNSHNSAI
jgi:hypothetical protein